MTDEKQDQIAKDLLYLYTQDKKKIAAFVAEFKEYADRFDELAKTLREAPETFAMTGVGVPQALIEYVQKLGGISKQYNDLGYRNAEREASLTSMGVL